MLATLSYFYYTIAPVIEMREQPSNDSEVVSQTIFSEQVLVLEEKEDWIKIQTEIDQYKGWIKKGEICQREEKWPSELSSVIAKVNRCAAHIYSVPDTIYGPMITLPFESLLEVDRFQYKSDSRWIKVSLPNGQQGFIQRGDIRLNPDLISREDMCLLSHQFLGLPYTWGGRSSFGYDCSGFVQMLYRQMDIQLPRDSKDQMQWPGFSKIEIEELQPGDLIFFGMSEVKIHHVGMFLGNNRFIHATFAENAPYIHISLLTDPEWKGLGKYTYRTARTLKNRFFL